MLTTRLLRQKTLDKRIESLAVDIEEQIAENEKVLEEYSFPEGASIRSDGVSSIEALVNSSI